MPAYEFQSSDVAANMAKKLIESDRYSNMLSGTDTDRIAFVHWVGKKKPASLPTPCQIKSLSPLMRAVAGDIVFAVVIYDEWIEWPEAKQYAALLEQLMLIKNDGRTTFEDGKLNKYDVLALSYMVNNFGLHWTSQVDVRHPIEDDPAPPANPGTPTFQGTTGLATAVESNPAPAVVSPEDLEAVDDALGDIPDDEADV